MAVYEDGMLAAARSDRSVALARLAAIALALCAAALFAIRLDAPAFFDNEGRYAEVAREMIVRGDWISPHLDFTLFLNKPPLAFWLAAGVFALGGPGEWARLASVAGAAVTLLATARLGALLYGEAAGLVAAAVLATTVGFVLEARTLRPDMLVAAAVVVALLCWQAAERARGRRGAWLVGFWAALGVGMLAKGFVPVVIVAIPVAACTLRDRGWRGLADLRPGTGLLVLAAIVLPWHVTVALRHPGFAWDYVVNQHVLAFFDEKLPRDSEGDTLAFFCSAFAGRAAPWVAFLPLTCGEAIRGAARRAAPAAASTFLLWTWAGGLLLFFSFAPSRLEHYSIPALPAVALLAARAWEKLRAGELGARAWAWLGSAGGAAAVVGLAGLVWGRGFLAQTYWIAQMPDLLSLATPAALALGLAGALVAGAAAARRADALVATLALAAVPLVVIVLRAETIAEPLFSWRPVGRAIVAAVPPDVDVAFEAPEEYQLVGGLVFYTGRRITLLRPRGFVPPTYLVDRVAGMFVDREDFERRWRAGERLAFVSDPQQRREEPSGLVPEPFHVLGRFGDRWVLTSFPVAVGR